MPAELGGSQISSLLEALPGIASVLRSPVADALIKAMRGAAGLADFAPEDAEELVRYAVRRGLIGPDEGDRVLAEVQEGLRTQLLGDAAILVRRPRYAPGGLFDLLDSRDDFREPAGGALGDRFDAAHLRLADRHGGGDSLDLFANHARGARDVLGSARGFVRQLTHLLGDH